MKAAHAHIKLLRENEGACQGDIDIIESGSEPQYFWQLFGLKRAPIEEDLWAYSNSWNDLFIDLSQPDVEEKRTTMVEQMQIDRERTEVDKYMKPRLYM